MKGQLWTLNVLGHKEDGENYLPTITSYFLWKRKDDPEGRTKTPEGRARDKVNELRQ